MSRLDYCQYSLLNRDCYDWKNDNCDECNIFKAYCEGARMAKASIVRCKDCVYLERKDAFGDEWKECTHYGFQHHTRLNDFCSWAEMKGGARMGNTK